MFRESNAPNPREDEGGCQASKAHHLSGAHYHANGGRPLRFVVVARIENYSRSRSIKHVPFCVAFLLVLLFLLPIARCVV